MDLFAKIHIHLPKDARIAKAGHLAELLYIRAILFAKEQLSDGAICASQLPFCAVGIPGEAKEHAERLVEVGLWEATEDGWRIPPGTWAKWQTTKAEVEQKRNNRAEAGRKGAASRWQNGKPMANAWQTDSKGHGKKWPETETETINTACAEPEQSPGNDDEVVYLSFPVKDGTQWPLTRGHLRRLHEGYGDRLDAKETAKEAKQWIEANPNRRKTRRGMDRFLNGWFLRKANWGFQHEAA